jgi:hypothetical protein
MATVYCLLLWLYPRSYRDEFGREMTLIFRAAQSALPPALAARLSFYRREYCGLLLGAARAHLDRLFGVGIPFRRFDMQPQFRFPRATVGLLLANFAGAMFVIAKGKAISRMAQPFWPVFGSVVIHLLVFAFLAVCTAAIFWKILHSRRRSGVHRLENVPTGTNSAEPTGSR